MKEKFTVNLGVQCPEKPEIISSINLDFVFTCDSSDYGNGYYCGVFLKENVTFLWYYLDLRYNTDFDSNKKELFILEWCLKNWSGENGSYKLISYRCDIVNE